MLLIICAGKIVISSVYSLLKALLQVVTYGITGMGPVLMVNIELIV
jgi:hypothetical protein